jgi:NitT/TauT family transport system substrate-binding protein
LRCDRGLYKYFAKKFYGEKNNMKNKFTIALGLAIALGLMLSGCSLTQTQGEPAEPTTLRIAVLPILDTLPMYVAQQEGLFIEHGVNVEFVPVASAPERDQIVSAGQADGMINETVSTIFYNKEQVQVQIVRYARVATTDTALFRILAAANSGIMDVQGLKGVEIGISQGTVIEYLTDRLLQAEGFSNDEIKTIAVPKIPDRMALLDTGELKAAMLPEPLSSLAAQQGAVVVLDDTRHPEFSFSTISFRKSVIDEDPEAIRAFLAAIEDAIIMINADPAKWSSLLSDLELVPPPLLGSFEVPTFATKGVPTQEQWNDALAWTKEKGLITQDVAYSDSVTDKYLP